MPRPRTIQREVDPIVAQLQQIREEAGVSQTEIGRRLGMTTYSNCSEYERGVMSPNLRAVRAWAEALGYDLVLRKKR